MKVMGKIKGWGKPTAQNNPAWAHGACIGAIVHARKSLGLIFSSDTVRGQEKETARMICDQLIDLEANLRNNKVKP